MSADDKEQKSNLISNDALKERFQSPEEEERWRLFRGENIQTELLRRIARDASEFQIKYRGCAQTCLYPLIVHLRPGGKSDPWAVLPGLSTLCYGINTGENICGAIVGALYALGMEFGRKSFYEPGNPREAGPSSFAASQARATEFQNRFFEKWGAVTCKGIQEKHYGGYIEPKGPQFWKMRKEGSLFDLLSIPAQRIISSAAVIAAEIILRERGNTPWLSIDEDM